MPADRSAARAVDPADIEVPGGTTMLTAIVALAAILRVREAMRTPLWMDEIITLWIARMEIPQMLRAIADDVHPPLHFLLVHGWRLLGGEEDLWIKTLSVVIGVALVWLMAPFGRALFEARAGLIAALLLALHPMHVLVSQEARFYALLWLWLVAAVGSGWRWLVVGRPATGIAFVLTAAAALYTHYLAAFPLATLAVFGVWDRRRDRRALLRWLGAHVAIALLFAPQVPIFLAQLGRDTSEHWVRPAPFSSLLEFARHLSFASRWLMVPLAVLAWLPLTRVRERRPALLLWLLVVVPTIGCWALTRAGMHLYTERYVAFATPFFCTLVAAGLAELGPRWLRISAIVVIAALGLRAVLVRPPFEEADALARAERYLLAHAAPGDPIVHADVHSLFFFRHHLATRSLQWLVWPTDRIPYYEGDHLIPREWRGSSHLIDSLAAGGQQWWAVRTRHGGTDSRPVTWKIEAVARGPVMEFGPVTVWGGRPIVHDSSATSLRGRGAAR